MCGPDQGHISLSSVPLSGCGIAGNGWKSEAQGELSKSPEMEKVSVPELPLSIVQVPSTPMVTAVTS